jgi:Domain of unknown function (DUF4266)
MRETLASIAAPAGRTIPRAPVPGARLSALAGRVLAIAALAGALALAGCGRQAVRAAEKEFLADQVMVFDEDLLESASDNHIRTNREGAAGGRGAGGGGCGCN